MVFLPMCVSLVADASQLRKSKNKVLSKIVYYFIDSVRMQARESTKARTLSCLACVVMLVLLLQIEQRMKVEPEGELIKS